MPTPWPPPLRVRRTATTCKSKKSEGTSCVRHASDATAVKPRARSFIAILAFILALEFSGAPCPAGIGTPPAEKVEIAAVLSTTGTFEAFGKGSLEGIQLALEEARASGTGPQIELKLYDAASSEERAKEIARQVTASRAVLVLGPSYSVPSLAAGPEFARAGLASITTTATSDLITDNPTTFRMLSKNSDQGEFLATYLVHVFDQRRAAVMVMDDDFGRPIETGFRKNAERLGIDATYHVFKDGDDIGEKIKALAPDIADRPIIFATGTVGGVKILTALRRLGHKGPYLGNIDFGIETFNSHFADLPEEKERKGFFCEALYGMNPMLLDSANAELLSFAERFQARFGHEPGWTMMAGYDAARLAIQAVQGMDANASDPPAMRAAVLKYLLSLNDPSRASPGLLGPLAFDAKRGRQTVVRMGRFNRSRFESAPLQIVSVRNPHETEIKSGAVFETQPGSYARMQQVVYSGLYLNQIMWIDESHFTFAADFYVWLRFTKNSSPGAADPTEIKFPDLSAGRFYRETPVEHREMADGTSYRLWRVQGEFRNPFDLRAYPFDRQTLRLRFFNVRDAADRIVYALDLGSSGTSGEKTDDTTASGASEDAFRGLTRWKFLGTHQFRENFLAKSSLGDPRRLGRESFRELSGYAATFALRRHSLSTIVKSLMPLWLMTCILYASLHFPPVLVQPKIGVAMTAVLTGVVLLNLVNSQLGSIGYTVAVEYAFYVYFALGLLQIVSVLLSEHLRAIGRPATADRADLWTRILFVGSICGVIVAAVLHT